MGSIQIGSFVDGVVPVLKAEDNWLKLAPHAAYATLQGNANFVAHDPEAEGWCAIVRPNGVEGPVFQETSHPLGHPDHVSAWLALTLPTHGPLYLPLSSTNGTFMFAFDKTGSTSSISSTEFAQAHGKGHTGEWRSGTRRQWCTLAHELEGLECAHGDTIVESPHWSCCGSSRFNGVICSNAPLVVGDEVARGPAEWFYEQHLRANRKVG